MARFQNVDDSKETVLPAPLSPSHSHSLSLSLSLWFLPSLFEIQNFPFFHYPFMTDQIKCLSPIPNRRRSPLVPGIVNFSQLTYTPALA